MTADTNRISRRQYEILSNFRYELRRYLRYSEQVTRKFGVTPLQYQLLLHVKGYPERDWATVTELAERLQAKHHGVVALVTRCEKAKLVERRADPEDRRRVYVHLTRKGEERLAKLADLHRQELVLLEKRFFVPQREDFEE